MRTAFGAPLGLQKAFNLPYAWVFTSGGGRASMARTAMKVANRKAVINVMAELGGGGAVAPDILHRTERGLRRILHSLGMLLDCFSDAVQGTRDLNAKGSVDADAAGLFGPLRSIGDDVEPNEVIGLMLHPDTLGSELDEITSPYTRMILYKRAIAQVVRGDAVFQTRRTVHHREMRHEGTSRNACQYSCGTNGAVRCYRAHSGT